MGGVAQELWCAVIIQYPKISGGGAQDQQWVGANSVNAALV